MEVNTLTNTTPGPGSVALSCLRIDPSASDPDLQPLQESDGKNSKVTDKQVGWESLYNGPMWNISFHFHFVF